MGSMQMAAGALGSALVSYFHNGTAVPMAILLMASSRVSFALQVGYKRVDSDSLTDEKNIPKLSK